MRELLYKDEVIAAIDERIATYDKMSGSSARNRVTALKELKRKIEKLSLADSVSEPCCVSCLEENEKWLS